MANAKIYKKTIDPSVQDGIDQSLILDPNAFYQNKFEFGDDWTEIKVGMFLSYTDSVTDDNKDFVSGHPDIDSGGTTNDTFSYIGLVEDRNSKYLPLDDGAGSYMGLRFNKIINITSTLDDGTVNRLNDNNSAYYRVRYKITNNTHSSDTNPDTVASDPTFPLTNISNQTSFCTYMAFKFKLYNKGDSTQQVGISQYNLYENNSDAWNNNDLTDVSLLNIKQLINGNDTLRGGEKIIDAVNGSTPYSIPDSFFFYNAFLDIRPRIHAIAVKKIS